MRMVRWMCGVKLQDRIPSKGLRNRLGLNDIISVLQQNRLRAAIIWATATPKPNLVQIRLQGRASG